MSVAFDSFHRFLTSPTSDTNPIPILACVNVGCNPADPNLQDKNFQSVGRKQQSTGRRAEVAQASAYGI
jgi:hypothetical protein